jgi:hypothetical protein
MENPLKDILVSHGGVTHHIIEIDECDLCRNVMGEWKEFLKNHPDGKIE